jgi:hypothetical protein
MNIFMREWSNRNNSDYLRSHYSGGRFLFGLLISIPGRRFPAGTSVDKEKVNFLINPCPLIPRESPPSTPIN